MLDEEVGPCIVLDCHPVMQPGTFSEQSQSQAAGRSPPLLHCSARMGRLREGLRFLLCSEGLQMVVSLAELCMQMIGREMACTSKKRDNIKSYYTRPGADTSCAPEASFCAVSFLI